MYVVASGLTGFFMGGWEASPALVPDWEWEPPPAGKNGDGPEFPAEYYSSRRVATGEGEEPAKPGTRVGG